VWHRFRQSLAVSRPGAHTERMAKRFIRALAGLAGLAVIAVPGVLTPVGAPAGAACAGGICDVCPAVATALHAAGAEIYCIA
jgi:hypothetical protein